MQQKGRGFLPPETRTREFSIDRKPTGEQRVAEDRTVSVLVTSTLILGRNSDRIWAGFTNVGANDIFIQLGAAAVLHEGLLVAPNGYFGIDELQYWAGEVFAIAETATTILSGVEVFRQP